MKDENKKEKNTKENKEKREEGAPEKINNPFGVLKDFKLPKEMK